MPSESENGGDVPPRHPELLVPFVVYVAVIVALLAVAIVVGLTHN